MAKGKYHDWLTPDGLLLLQAWARDGLSDEQIAKKCGIATATLYDWKNKFPEFSDALRKGKEVVDVEVENALYKKTLGYKISLKKTFKVRKIEYSKETGKKISEKEELVEGEDEIYVQPDTVAQMYWLNNRKPAQWRSKPADAPKDDDNTGVVMMPPVDGDGDA